MNVCTFMAFLYINDSLKTVFTLVAKTECVCILTAYILKTKFEEHIIRIAQLANHDIYKYI